MPIVFSSLVSIDNCLGGCGLRLLNVELFVEKWLDPETTTKALYPWLQSGKGAEAPKKPEFGGLIRRSDS